MAGRSTKWIIGGIVGVVIIVGLWVFAIAAVLNSGDSYSGDRDWPEEVIVDAGREKVAIVSVFGEIFSDPEGLSPGASDHNVLGQLDQAAHDSRVKAIIIDLDTPGGGVVASDAIYRRAVEISKDGIPVVALMRDVAASGGYYIAAGADHIVANAATLTGSIGVIMFLPNFTGSAEKLGIEPIVIKSGPYKDIASPYKDMTPDERKILQGIIDESYEQFVEAVSEGRGLEFNRVKKLADGRIYTGSQAFENGLVDSLGDTDAAFSEAKTLAGYSDASLVRYRRSVGFAESLLGLTNRDPAQEFREAVGLARPGLHYLWLSPG